MDCIFEKRSPAPALYKRAPTTPSATGGEESSGSNKQAVIIAATVGSLFLISSLALFLYCVRKRRASRRIGQLQKFLPTFMDQEKTEKYFQKHGSSSSLVGPISPKEPTLPSHAHYRTRSAGSVPVIKGVTDHRNRHIERDGSMGQFQQISLSASETKEADLKRSVSIRSTRARAATVTAPPPAISSLHRGVSLNKHSAQGSSSGRSDIVEEYEGELHDKFAEGEIVAPNRFSVLLDFDQAKKNNRFSAQSIVDLDPDFDPSRFSSGSLMFDAKRLSQDSSRSSGEEFRNTLPPHQQQHSFHSHHNSPTVQSREASMDVSPHASQPSFVGGDKQELEDDDDFMPQPAVGVQPVMNNHPGTGYYPSVQQNASMPVALPAHMQMHNPIPGSASPPIPKRPLVPTQPQIMVSQPHGGPSAGGYQVNEHHY